MASIFIFIDKFVQPNLNYYSCKAFFPFQQYCFIEQMYPVKHSIRQEAEYQRRNRSLPPG